MDRQLVDSFVREIKETNLTSGTVEERNKRRLQMVIKHSEEHYEEIMEAIKEYNSYIGCYLSFFDCGGAACGGPKCMRITINNVMYNLNCCNPSAVNI